MQPKEQMIELADNWAVHAASFAEVFASELPGVDAASLGERLQAIAQEVGSDAHPFGMEAGMKVSRHTEVNI